VDFVGVATVLLEGMLFEAVWHKAEGLVEAKSGKIVAYDGELDEFDARAGGVDHCLHEEPRGAGAAMRGADVHGTEPAFVGVFAAGEDTEGGDADDLSVIEGAEDLGVGEPAGIFFQGSGLLVFEGTAESFGIEAESFEADFPEEFNVGGGELADSEGHSYR